MYYLSVGELQTKRKRERTPADWQMEDYVFENWLKTVLLAQKKRRPDLVNEFVLVFLDGHGSYLTYNTATMAPENKVSLVCKPPNCHHALQPLDVGFFAPAKRHANMSLRHGFERHETNPLQNLFFLVFSSS